MDCESHQKEKKERGGERERERERERVGQVTEPLKAMRDTDVWKVMIAYAKEHGT